MGAATIKKHPQPTNGDSKLENKLILQTQLTLRDRSANTCWSMLPAQPIFSLVSLHIFFVRLCHPQAERFVYAFFELPTSLFLVVSVGKVQPL